MSDQPTTGEWTALEFFGIVHGKGDAGSEFAFHSQNPEVVKGWVRLAANISLAHTAALAAEREKAAELMRKWDKESDEQADEIQQLREQLAESEKRADELAVNFVKADMQLAAAQAAHQPLVDALNYSKEVQQFAKTVTTGRQDRRLEQMEIKLEKLTESTLAKVKEGK